MNDRLKQAFNKIQAEEELKNSTKAFLYQKQKGMRVQNYSLSTLATCYCVFSACNIWWILALFLLLRLKSVLM